MQSHRILRILTNFHGFLEVPWCIVPTFTPSERCRTAGPMVKRTPGAIETALVLRRRLRDMDISEARLCQVDSLVEGKNRGKPDGCWQNPMLSCGVSRQPMMDDG